MLFVLLPWLGLTAAFPGEPMLLETITLPPRPSYACGNFFATVCRPEKVARLAGADLAHFDWFSLQSQALLSQVRQLTSRLLALSGENETKPVDPVEAVVLADFRHFRSAHRPQVLSVELAADDPLGAGPHSIRESPRLPDQLLRDFDPDEMATLQLMQNTEVGSAYFYARQVLGWEKVEELKAGAEPIMAGIRSGFEEEIRSLGHLSLAEKRAALDCLKGLSVQLAFPDWLRNTSQASACVDSRGAERCRGQSLGALAATYDEDEGTLLIPLAHFEAPADRADYPPELRFAILGQKVARGVAEFMLWRHPGLVPTVAKDDLLAAFRRFCDVDGVCFDPRLTLGRSSGLAAELMGLRVAWRSFSSVALASAAAATPAFLGTPERRFFAAFGRAQCGLLSAAAATRFGQYREAAYARRSPPAFLTLQLLRELPEWATAFHCPR